MKSTTFCHILTFSFLARYGQGLRRVKKNGGLSLLIFTQKPDRRRATEACIEGAEKEQVSQTTDPGGERGKVRVQMSE